MTTKGLSDTGDTANDDFSAISSALASGDTENLDKLMSKTATEVQEEVDTNQEVPDTEVDENAESGKPDDEGKVPDKDTSVATTEAAPAASTAPAVEDVEAIKQELHRYRSDAGRVPHMQRRMAELERELRAYKARTTEGSNDGKTTVGSSVDPKSVVLDEETQRTIDEFKETDPALAKALERVARSAIAAANSRVDTAVTTLTQSEQEAEDYRFYMEQKTELLRVVPQAEQIFATPEWKAWKERLTPGQRAMAESAYATDVSQAIYAFAADMQRLQTNAQAAPAAVTTPPEKSEVAEARERKAASVETKNTSPKQTADFDAEAYFREQYRKAGKESHIL